MSRISHRLDSLCLGIELIFCQHLLKLPFCSLFCGYTYYLKLFLWSFLSLTYLGDVDYRLCITWIIQQQISGYRVEEKLNMGVREKKKVDYHCINRILHWQCCYLVWLQWVHWVPIILTPFCYFQCKISLWETKGVFTAKYCARKFGRAFEGGGGGVNFSRPTAPSRPNREIAAGSDGHGR
jgi:hypothetical protein